MHLTVGVVARNGLPHLHRCLASLPALAGAASGVDFVLVDSASSDGTLEAMLAFARGRSDTRVLAMRGRVNHAATRNLVLQNARPGAAVFLVDGDVEVNPAFVAAALAELERGTCDVAFGRLPEVLHDGAHRPVGRTVDRYRVLDRGHARLIHGIVLLGPAVMAAGVRYDEAQRRCEDLELGVRLADRFRILALPIVMGTHYTVSYYAPARLGAFYGESYLRPMGRLIRKHLLAPRRLWALREMLGGHALGLLLQLSAGAALLLGSAPAGAAVGAFVGLDVARSAYRGRLHEYVPKRVVAPWQIVHGFVFPETEEPSYDVEQHHPLGHGT